MSSILRPRVLLTITAVIAAMVASAILIDVPLAHIQLPAEPVLVIPGINFPITNTVIALLSADVILIAMALIARRQIGDVPRGLFHMFEVVIGYWQDLAVQLVGEERTKRWLPLVLTMFFMIVVSNWMELLPGFDSVGLTCVTGECPGEQEGLVSPEQEHTYFVFEEIAGIKMAVDRVEASESETDAHDDASDDAHSEEEAATDEAASDEEHADEAEGDHGGHAENEKVLIPFYRVPASDLNFTLALALIAFVVIEFAGFNALGLGYLKKFFSFKSPLAFFVGIVELLSEFARIISFTFRLFGNLFAGQVLLFIMPFLVPFLLVMPFYGLELFVGIIQGFVFAMLTLVFMSIAIESHDEH